MLTSFDLRIYTHKVMLGSNNENIVLSIFKANEPTRKSDEMKRP